MGIIWGKLGCRSVIYEFLDFQVDTGQFALRRDGEAVHVEPLIFDLITLFATCPGQVLDKDLLIAEVWQGRFISDASLSSAIKAARKALGDSGEAQQVIETIRGRGFRFAPKVTVTGKPATAVPAAPQAEPARPVRAARPSLAVLPFSLLGGREDYQGIEEAIAHDLITALSRARWLTVIARGSTFRFRGAGLDLAEVGRALGVRYCLTGTLELFGNRIALAVELTEAATGAVVWADRKEGRLDDIHLIRNEIVTGVASELESQIQNHEALQARDLATEHLDAWQAFHLGLRHVHRSTDADNRQAEELFRLAIARDPAFARAYAGLSQAYFRNAFLNRGGPRADNVAQARKYAEKAVELDQQDPFANFSMGRSFWLQADLDRANHWLERATHVSPNYAQGIYANSLMLGLSGESGDAVRLGETSIALSPLDPLLYGMRSAVSLAHLAQGDDASALDWGEAAAQTAQAHELVEMIAAGVNQITGNAERARYWAESAQRRGPNLSVSAFFDALPSRHADSRSRLTTAFKALGFAD